MVRQETGVAFSVDAETFMAFARSLPNGIPTVGGVPLQRDHLVDFDLCWAYELADPWGNRYECNTYEYDRIRTELVEADGIAPQRFWPSELLAGYRDTRA